MKNFLTAYLSSYLFWLQLPLGSLAIMMTGHLTGGKWYSIICPQLTAAIRTLPVMAVLFLPILFGVRSIYPWADQQTNAYLGVHFFQLRSLFYFALWIALTSVIIRISSSKAPALSAVGLIAYGLSGSFAAIDWIMSLQPSWFSTTFGLIFLVGQALGAFAFVLVAAALTQSETDESDKLLNLGNVLLTLVMTFTYLAFMQFLIIWSGNLPEEVQWYLARLQGNWGPLAVALILFQFAVPFLFLLFRSLKNRRGKLAIVAVLVLAFRWVYLYWEIAPAIDPERARGPWLEIATLAGLGVIWLALYHYFFRRGLPTGRALTGSS